MSQSVSAGTQYSGTEITFVDCLRLIDANGDFFIFNIEDRDGVLTNLKDIAHRQFVLLKFHR